MVTKKNFPHAMGTSNVEVLLLTTLLAKQTSMCMHVFVYIIIYIIICSHADIVWLSPQQVIVCEPTEFSVTTSQLHIIISP